MKGKAALGWQIVIVIIALLIAYLINPTAMAPFFMGAWHLICAAWEVVVVIIIIIVVLILLG